MKNINEEIKAITPKNIELIENIKKLTAALKKMVARQPLELEKGIEAEIEPALQFIEESLANAELIENIKKLTAALKKMVVRQPLELDKEIEAEIEPALKFIEKHLSNAQQENQVPLTSVLPDVISNEQQLFTVSTFPDINLELEQIKGRTPRYGSRSDTFSMETDLEKEDEYSDNEDDTAQEKIKTEKLEKQKKSISNFPQQEVFSDLNRAEESSEKNKEEPHETVVEELIILETPKVTKLETSDKTDSQATSEEVKLPVEEVKSSVIQEANQENKEVSSEKVEEEFPTYAVPTEAKEANSPDEYWFTFRGNAEEGEVRTRTLSYRYKYEETVQPQPVQKLQEEGEVVQKRGVQITEVVHSTSSTDVYTSNVETKNETIVTQEEKKPPLEIKQEDHSADLLLKQCDENFQELIKTLQSLDGRSGPYNSLCWIRNDILSKIDEGKYFPTSEEEWKHMLALIEEFDNVMDGKLSLETPKKFDSTILNLVIKHHNDLLQKKRQLFWGSYKKLSDSGQKNYQTHLVQLEKEIAKTKGAKKDCKEMLKEIREEVDKNKKNFEACNQSLEKIKERTKLLCEKIKLLCKSESKEGIFPTDDEERKQVSKLVEFLGCTTLGLIWKSSVKCESEISKMIRDYFDDLRKDYDPSFRNKLSPKQRHMIRGMENQIAHSDIGYEVKKSVEEVMSSLEQEKKQKKTVSFNLLTDEPINPEASIDMNKRIYLKSNDKTPIVGRDSPINSQMRNPQEKMENDVPKNEIINRKYK